MKDSITSSLFAQFFVIVFLFACPAWCFFSFSANNLGGGINGGNNCAACTIAVGIVEQLTEIHNSSVTKVLDDVCGWFPSTITPICDYFVDKYGPQVIALIEAEQTSDVICHQLEFCTSPTCRLFPPPTKSLPSSFVLPENGNGQSTNRKLDPLRSRMMHKISVLAESKGEMESGNKENKENKENGKIENKETPWQWIEDLMNRMSKYHEPVVDMDHDNYSSVATMRGYSWKGKDCNDLDSKYRPGLVEDSQSTIDYNCNGISGYDDTMKTSWEDELCGNSGPLGVAVVGDSFGAHFSIPPSYMNASEINESTYVDLLSCIENEFDWPERSAFTGYENVTGVMIDSIYLRMRERNRCNHRDYQNVGVNGCRSTTLQSRVINSLSRDQKKDHPLLLVLELIGNDVCSSTTDFDRMSTVEVFTTALLEILQYLDDSVLPAGSHIVFIGLADGRMLWNSLHERTHPVGVSYETVYEFMNCLEISPCWGWMNVNETVRNMTSERAAELSAVYPQIVANYTFKNFDMAYYDFPLADVIKEWTAMGGETWQLIEPIDGFHPNQIAHALIAGNLWNKIINDHPTFVGDINPNNDLIEKMFGGQGGY